MLLHHPLNHLINLIKPTLLSSNSMWNLFQSLTHLLALHPAHFSALEELHDLVKLMEIQEF